MISAIAYPLAKRSTHYMILMAFAISFILQKLITSKIAYAYWFGDCYFELNKNIQANMSFHSIERFWHFLVSKFPLYLLRGSYSLHEASIL